jgi:methylated-DNA-[protein]-cysteine S-methyltransferase
MNDNFGTAYTHSPIGFIAIKSFGEYICEVTFVDKITNLPQDNTPILKECIHQLAGYFSGKLFKFHLPTTQGGTVFQHQVWNHLLTIPYCKTISYGQMALQLGQPKSARAIGAACGKNQLLILHPCHRVIGANKQLTGFTGGLWRKEWLLKHEATQSKLV